LVESAFVLVKVLLVKGGDSSLGMTGELQRQIIRIADVVVFVLIVSHATV